MASTSTRIMASTSTRIMGSISTSLKFAVLIDADNASPAMAGSIITEIAKYGTTFVKRAYGDWTGSGLKSWKERLLEQSIQPIQQFAYTKGKNSTDSAMIIDAMDLLYSGKFGGFCIVSSDSDFTRLASRIRESGLVVFGCGERKTPRPFVTACDKFIYLENLVTMTGPPKFGIAVTRPPNAGLSIAGPISIGPSIARPSKDQEVSVPSANEKEGNRNENHPLKSNTQVEGAQLVDSLGAGTPSPGPHPVDREAVKWLQEAIEVSSDDEGWALLSEVGSLMIQWHSDFDPRTYGFKKLSQLMTSIACFETSNRSPGDGKPWVVYARYMDN